MQRPFKRGKLFPLEVSRGGGGGGERGGGKDQEQGNPKRSGHF